MKSSIKLKQAEIKETKQIMADAKSLIICTHQKLVVNELNELRVKLREEDAQFKIIKKNTIKRSLDFKLYPELEKEMTGPNGYVLSFNDELAGVRILADFSKKHKQLKIKAGILGSKWIPIEDLNQLALLPNRDGLISMLLSCFQAPISKLARTLKALSEKKNKRKHKKGVKMAKIKKEDLIAGLKEMSLLEINDLIKAIEEEFGVTAAAPMAAAAEAAADEAPTEVTVHLKSFGPNKVSVIKIVRELTGLGLMDAKKKVESAPTAIKENIKPEEAEEISAKLKDAGAEVEVK